MTTVQQVFDAAIHLMDEQSETSGQTLTTDTNEYKFRTISILNTVMPTLYPYSDTCDRSGIGRPICPALKSFGNYAAPDMTQTIPLDDGLAMGVLPYALAAHLLASENEELSMWLMNRFQQAFGQIRNFMPASFEPITAPYGLF
jgi:hypothetical protein